MFFEPRSVTNRIPIFIQCLKTKPQPWPTINLSKKRQVDKPRYTIRANKPGLEEIEVIVIYWWKPQLFQTRNLMTRHSSRSSKSIQIHDSARCAGKGHVSWQQHMPFSQMCGILQGHIEKQYVYPRFPAYMTQTFLETLSSFKSRHSKPRYSTGSRQHSAPWLIPEPSPKSSRNIVVILLVGFVNQAAKIFPQAQITQGPVVRWVKETHVKDIVASVGRYLEVSAAAIREIKLWSCIHWPQLI